MNFMLTKKFVQILLLSLALFNIGAVVEAYEDDPCGYIDQYTFKAEHRACLRMEILGSGSVDCVDCLFYEEPKTNPWVEALGIVAGPLAMVGSTYIASRYAYKGQQAWADAYRYGHEACTNRFNAYTNYLQERGAAPMLPEQAQPMVARCNGIGMNGNYAGYGGLYGNGFGGFGNPYLSAGFSPGFMGG